jgi:hypothetical protein
MAKTEKKLMIRAKGFEKAMFRLEPGQLQALRREALRRAGERGSMKPDASELVREAVEAWLKAKKG